MNLPSPDFLHTNTDQDPVGVKGQCHYSSTYRHIFGTTHRTLPVRNPTQINENDVVLFASPRWQYVKLTVYKNRRHRLPSHSLVVGCSIAHKSIILDHIRQKPGYIQISNKLSNKTFFSNMVPDIFWCVCLGGNSIPWLCCLVATAQTLDPNHISSTSFILNVLWGNGDAAYNFISASHIDNDDFCMLSSVHNTYWQCSKILKKCFFTQRGLHYFDGLEYLRHWWTIIGVKSFSFLWKTQTLS